MSNVNYTWNTSGNESGEFIWYYHDYLTIQNKKLLRVESFQVWSVIMSHMNDCCWTALILGYSFLEVLEHI